MTRFSHCHIWVLCVFLITLFSCSSSSNINSNPSNIDLDTKYIIVIASGHSRFDRRTWQRAIFRASGAPQLGFALLFLLDDLDEVDHAQIESEKSFGDVFPSYIPRGFRTAERMVIGMTYAVQHHPNFEFILFTDDDNLWCFWELAKLLPTIQAQYPHFIFGFLHDYPGYELKWIDEHSLITTRSIVDDILARNETLKCVPFGDLSLTNWLLKENGCKLDSHIIYSDANQFFPHTKSEELFDSISPETVCRDYLSLHYVRDHQVFFNFSMAYRTKHRPQRLQALGQSEQVSTISQEIASMMAKIQKKESYQTPEMVAEHVKRKYNFDEDYCWIPESEKHNLPPQKEYNGGY